MALKSWKLPKTNAKLTEILAKECGISSFIAEILINRGITNLTQAYDFLQHDSEMEDPFVLVDMHQAVERIHTALEAEESIVVYGDYDCDGVTSSAILYTYLHSLGANVSYYIPDRESEGYGLHADALTKLAEQGASLIITVDNGISAIQEVAHANSLGLTVIITDHHQVGDTLPPAYAILNPHRKDCPSSFKQIAGVGVAFKLITALEQGDYNHTFEQFADILAIGTVADVVPLIGENRIMVQRGLKALKATDNLGLMALMQAANLSEEKISSHSIAFTIAPRINAAGRMKDATLALRLLLCEDPDQAHQLAQQMELLNQQRKTQESEIHDAIRQRILDEPVHLSHRVLAFYGADWHPGIIGIVSSRILEAYGKPNLIMSLKDGRLKGSARSVEFFHMHQALTHCAEHLIQYGGHAMAAGFLLHESNFEAFQHTLEAYAQKYHPIMPPDTSYIDFEIQPEHLTLENIKTLDILQPFGAGNQTPLFLIKSAQIQGITPLSENRHCRIQLLFGGETIKAVLFGTSPQQLPYRTGQTVDVVCTVSINYYNAREYLSILVKDMRLSGFEEHHYFQGKAYYEMFLREEALPADHPYRSIPTRDQIALIYKYLVKHQGHSGDIDQLYPVFERQGIAYYYFRIILDILQDVALIRLSPLLDEISMLPTTQKVDLSSAKTMQRLHAALDAGSSSDKS